MHPKDATVILGTLVNGNISNKIAHDAARARVRNNLLSVLSQNVAKTNATRTSLAIVMKLRVKKMEREIERQKSICIIDFI